MTQVQSNDFFLGRAYEPTKGVQDQKVSYDMADLTTHAVVTGMTGSGKTGACIGILEEAALKGIPAIIIDFKGDLTNLLLHFPNQIPDDFEPWIDPESARRAGKPLHEMAKEAAGRWQAGLAEWGLGREELLALQAAARFNVYTPGSTAGTPVNILSSFAAPELNWEENKEVLREQIASTVTAVLSLTGMDDIDPLRSREHILISNLLEAAWSQGKSLDLNELILQVQNPPFERLGAFPLENFFAKKDRFSLAMLLNNFLASPSFQTWQEGQPLHIPDLLYTANGLPRNSIFYLAHLNDTERMFFVTLLLSAVEAWMRTQRGTSGLRAIVYIDEILGYFPPVANPPSRPVLLRLIKQARAFGVGLLLATQNPVDLDYKALSNAGTWIIGRLQTERDIDRLLDGLQNAGAGIDASAFKKIISGLGQQVFLLHNVHSPAPVLYQTRWTLNFLAGPLTRVQIPALNRMAANVFAAATAPVAHWRAAAEPTTQPVLPGAAAYPAPQAQSFAVTPEPAVVMRAVPVPSPAAQSGFSTTRPAVPTEINEYFLPNRVDVGSASRDLNLPPTLALQAEGIVYRPALLAQADIRYNQRRYNLDYDQRMASLVEQAEPNRIRWEDYAVEPLDASELHSSPLPQARFAAMPGWLSDAKRLKALQTDFIDWVYRSGTIHVHANETLKVYAGPEMTSAEFREICSQTDREGLNADLQKVKGVYDRKMAAIEQKINHQKMEVRDQEDEVGQRRMEELGTHGELILSIFSRRRRSVSTSLTKHRLTQQSQANLQQDREELAAYEDQLDQLEAELKAAVEDTQDRWARTVNDGNLTAVEPMKKDIFAEYFGVVWLPYYLIRVDNEIREARAF